MFIYMVSVVMGSMWVVMYFLEKRKKTYKPYFFLLLLLFLATQILSAYFSIDRHTSLFGYYGRWNGGIVSIMAYIVLFFVFVQIVTKKTALFLLKVTLASSLVVILWGLLSKIGYDFSCLIFTGNLSNICWTDQFRPAVRIFATIGQPNWLGAYLCIHFFIGLYFFVKEYLRDQWQSLPLYGYGSYLVLCTLAIYFTRSRSALLALGIGVLLGILLVLVRKIKPVYTAVLLLAISGFMLVLNPFDIASQLHSPSPDDVTVTESFDIRKIVWQGALDLGLRYPYFGTGVETFAYAYYFTRPPEHNRTSEWDFIYNKAHNEYLNYFATTGFVGLIGYVCLIVAVCILVYRIYAPYRKKQTTALLAEPSLYLFLSYVTILITNFFGFSTSTSQLFFYTIPAFILVMAGMNQKELVEDEETSSLPLYHKISIGLAIMLGLVGVNYIRNYYVADLKYNAAKTYMASSDYAKAMLNLHDALTLRDEHVYEDKLSSTLAYLAFQYSFDDKERSQELIELSKFSNYRTLASSPYNMLYWKTQARNYYLYYQISHNEKDMEQAIRAMERALEIAPTDVQTMYALAVLYVTAGEETKNPDTSTIWKDKARATLVEIFKLKPDYREAQQLGGEV